MKKLATLLVMSIGLMFSVLFASSPWVQRDDGVTKIEVASFDYVCLNSEVVINQEVIKQILNQNHLFHLDAGNNEIKDIPMHQRRMKHNFKLDLENLAHRVKRKEFHYRCGIHMVFNNNNIKRAFI